LLSTAGAGRRALARAFLDLHGFGEAMQNVRLHGSTDPRILDQVYRNHWGRAPTDAESERLIEVYLGHLEHELAGTEYRVLPGGRELLAALEAKGRAIGLATGNVEKGARMKLRPGGIDGHFKFGGYGSDAYERAKVVQAGVDRGQAYLRSRGEAPAKSDRIFVLGDTEDDVKAARAVGAIAVGILAGSGVQDELRRAAPDLLVESMADPVLWRALDLDPP
jgi:phosphoglycolate phosphatase